MNCPKCFEPLKISDRQGIEIDYCPDCRGVWLDRGELDKIIERTMQSDMHQYREPDRDYRQPNNYHRDQERYHRGYHKSSKKKHFIKELFDLFD
jgi:Zn-finger nucleic acid-binding protein